MLKQGSFSAVIKSNHFGKNGGITGFFDISACTCNQPQRIVIETAADIRISFFGKRLILVVGAAVAKLCGGNIQDTFPRPFRDQVYEAEKILSGIPEAHSSADTGFIIGSAAGHVKGNHTLILVPDIYHTVYFFTIGRNLITGKQFLPVIR